jgi:hypothetical protein
MAYRSVGEPCCAVGVCVSAIAEIVCQLIVNRWEMVGIKRLGTKTELAL